MTKLGKNLLGSFTVIQEHQAEKIIFTLDELKLDAQMMRGQGYDGDGNMAGKKGTPALIQEQYPLAVYTCASHVLNLCIMEGMSIVLYVT